MMDKANLIHSKKFGVCITPPSDGAPFNSGYSAGPFLLFIFRPLFVLKIE